MGGIRAPTTLALPARLASTCGANDFLATIYRDFSSTLVREGARKVDQHDE